MQYVYPVYIVISPFLISSNEKIMREHVKRLAEVKVSLKNYYPHICMGS